MTNDAWSHVNCSCRQVQPWPRGRRSILSPKQAAKNHHRALTRIKGNHRNWMLSAQVEAKDGHAYWAIENMHHRRKARGRLTRYVSTNPRLDHRYTDEAPVGEARREAPNKGATK